MPVEYADFISKVKQKLGIDLSLYKEAQMKRRLTSLRDKRGFHSFQAYFLGLENNPILMNEFIDRLTINVSEFYRNPKRWEVLKNDILPAIVKQHTSISIWSAACSTGEEPYSIAMLMREHFPQVSFRIIATDLDEGVLEKAKQGIYREQALKELPEAWKKKYFNEKNGLYTIDPALKKKIVFKRHNLLADTYPSQQHIIICRNVLIYFTEQAKKSIYQHFSQALVDEGVLFVGSTEQIFHPETYRFKLTETFFYQKK